MWGRAQLFSLVALLLAGVTVAWLLRGGHFRRGRLWLVTLAGVAVIALLARRMGWGELAVLGLLAFVPLFVLPAGRREDR